MKTGQFDQLSITEKALLIQEFGDRLLSIEFYDHRIHLYSLNCHFIEIYYNIELRKVERISIASYSDLDKYLARIIIGAAKEKANR